MGIAVRDAIISLSMGVALVAFGSMMLRWHFQSWAQHKADPHLDERDLFHFGRQFRRRLQISGLLVLLGVLIPAGDLLVPWQRFPRAFVIFWMVLVLIALWIMMLAALDWLSGRVYARKHESALANLRQHQQELEQEVARLRQQRGNGQHH